MKIRVDGGGKDDEASVRIDITCNCGAETRFYSGWTGVIICDACDEEILVVEPSCDWG